MASPTWRDEVPDALVVGRGEMRWLGFRIYRAVLWGDRQPFDPGSKFALQLTYYRSISRDRLVNTSMDEMRRIGSAPRDEVGQTRWRSLLQGAFVDVQPGDQLTGVSIPGYGMRFYHGEKQLADISDPVLAKAFFDIWLNEKSRDPELRSQLLGKSP
ncbi:hypothetical protein GM658_11100 [Pseudoduganella eburnea]|uniref:Chalcone isomerase domain-containing protein n=2 Tax=Massilia eburnea TaxID=1776165 RepID=A0A6L6QG94_9BURK|nr:hypothetical protein [Massilia eburnea]